MLKLYPSGSLPPFFESLKFEFGCFCFDKTVSGILFLEFGFAYVPILHY